MARRAEAGFTLIELMVSLVIASMAVGFIFRIYATTSVAYRTQSQISEVQQALRTAKQVIAKDVRQAGYFAGQVNTQINTGVTGHVDADPATTTPTGVFMYSPIQVINSSSGPDELHLVYADTTCIARVTQSGPAFTAAVSQVDSLSCFADGDVVVAVRTADGSATKKGQGCVLKVTGLVAGGPKLQHNPGGSGSPYNEPGNAQCDHIKADWNDGLTAFMKFQAKGYRIKPNDARGVLQVSPTAGASADWEDLAFGFVDMQFAILVYEPGDSTDSDGMPMPGTTSTLSPEWDWYSGNNMNTLDFSTKEAVELRINLIARTVAEVDGVVTSATPTLLGSSTRPSNNDIGDHDFTTTATQTGSSMYAGNYVYRMITTVVDLRNLGIGRAQ